MSEQELKDKIGVYLDPALKRFWTLDVEDGKLAVSAISGMRFLIAPVSQTEFREFEVPASYKIGVENGRLVVAARRGRNLVLTPALKDEFLSGGFNFEFTRDRQNQVNGFLMDTDRSLNVRFVKRK